MFNYIVFLYQNSILYFLSLHSVAILLMLKTMSLLVNMTETILHTVKWHGSSTVRLDQSACVGKDFTG